LCWLCVDYDDDYDDYGDVHVYDCIDNNDSDYVDDDDNNNNDNHNE